MNIMDALSIVSAHPDDAETPDILIEAWQALVDDGVILFTLPGRYGRAAQILIDDGLLTAPRMN